jgi:hypothetical protein
MSTAFAASAAAARIHDMNDEFNKLMYICSLLPLLPLRSCMPAARAAAAAAAAARIRDLNDEINKLIREKGHWERRIVELGGPDYTKTAPKITGAYGAQLRVQE